MYASPPKTVFMKTVALCPSDTSSGAGTGTAPLREQNGDRKTDKEKTPRNTDRNANGTYKKQKGEGGGGGGGNGGSFDANVV